MINCYFCDLIFKQDKNGRSDHKIQCGKYPVGRLRFETTWETMSYLREHHLDQLLLDLRQPVLGICLGMQLMCRHSEEGNVDCLGIFPTDVKRFIPQKHEEKVPHMGWNAIQQIKEGLFTKDLEGQFVYFVHSYYVPVNPDTAAVTDYIHPFSAALHKDNYYATQFHPEKSGTVGERILKNFLEL